VEIDACIASGDPAQMTRLCIAETIGALNRSLYFASKKDETARRNCLLKAISSIQALQLGVDRDHPMGVALLTLYGSACAGVTRSLRYFDETVITAIRRDFLDIEQAFAAVQA
jgi:hypothetical protein